MATFSIPWDCPECCEEVCAEIYIQCMCCGNHSFQPGKQMIDFYNYLCVCPYCGRTMKGHRAVEPSCDSPYASVNTLGTTGGTMYHYLHAEWGIYVVSPYLEMAQQDAVPGSTITDNCGNTFEA